MATSRCDSIGIAESVAVIEMSRIESSRKRRHWIVLKQHRSRQMVDVSDVKQHGCSRYGRILLQPSAAALSLLSEMIEFLHETAFSLILYYSWKFIRYLVQWSFTARFGLGKSRPQMFQLNWAKWRKQTLRAG